MIPSIKFEKIEIYSFERQEEKLIFEWEFKNINFLCFGNNSGKTTFFHIMKDILGNPNVAGQGTKGKTIFTYDLLQKNIECIVDFTIGKFKYKTIKRYIPITKQTFYNSNGEIVGRSIEDFLNFLKTEEIIKFPQVIYNNKHVLTLNSIMRLCYISSGHYTNKITLKNNHTTNVIIKHNNDGFAKILFYGYILGILNDDGLLDQYYKIAGSYSRIVNELNEIETKIKLISKHDIQDNGLLFDDSMILDEIGENQKILRGLSLDNINYENILYDLKELHYFNTKLDNLDNLNLDFLELIKKDIESISKKIIQNQIQINKLKQDTEKKQKELKKIDEFLIQHYLRELKTIDKNEDKQLLKNLLIQKEEKRIIKKNIEEHYNQMVKNILKDEIFSNFNNYLNILTGFLKGVNIEINSQNGVYITNTTADSINRVILFNIIISFIFLKKVFDINHPNFVFFDSPFIGLDIDIELNALKTFLNKYKEFNLDGQVFISLNPQEVDIEKLISQNLEYISIKKGNKGEKIFNL